MRKGIGTGEGRVAAVLIVFAGILLCASVVILLFMKSVRGLEQGGANER